MADQQQKSTQNWFERNPKKAIALFLFMFLLALTYGAEKLLAHINHTHNLVLFTERRYINLREVLPFVDTVDVPPDKAVRDSDGLAHKPYRVRTDANGFILPYNIYARPDKTVVFLGGSTTECFYMAEEDRFPYLVGQILEQKTGKKITSINSGVGGNNTMHCINILLNKVVVIKPDMVVLMENINDLASMIYNKTYWSSDPSRAIIVNFTFYKNLRGFKALSTVFRDIYIPNLHVATRVLSKKIFGKGRIDPDDEFAHARGKKLDLPKEQLLEVYKSSLQTFIGICRAWKITPVLMTQFNRFKAEPDENVLRILKGFQSNTGIPPVEFMDIYHKFNQAVLEVGAANRVLVIDMAHLIPQEKQYMYDIVHLNNEGARLAARIISSRLRPMVTP